MSFENWLNKVENKKLFLEKAQQELLYNRYTDNHSFWKTILEWLQSAYNMGLQENNNMIQSLKNEIKTQRKEIAALREERRLLLDRDRVPEIGWKE